MRCVRYPVGRLACRTGSSEFSHGFLRGCKMVFSPVKCGDCGLEVHAFFPHQEVQSDCASRLSIDQAQFRQNSRRAFDVQPVIAPAHRAWPTPLVYGLRRSFVYCLASPTISTRPAFSVAGCTVGLPFQCCAVAFFFAPIMPTVIAITSPNSP